MTITPLYMHLLWHIFLSKSTELTGFHKNLKSVQGGDCEEMWKKIR